MKTFTVLIFGIIVSLLSYFSFASDQPSDLKVDSCGHDNIAIFYEIKADYLIGCDGIARAKKFFTNYGYAVDIPIHMYFRQRVTVDVKIPEADQEQIYGCFDSKTMSVYISSLASPFVRDSDRVFFRIEFQPGCMLEEYHRSVVAHEFAHLFAQHNFNLRADAGLSIPNMGHGVQEYIALVVQLRSMESNFYSTHTSAICA